MSHGRGKRPSGLFPFLFFKNGIISIPLAGERGPIPGHRKKDRGALVGDTGIFSQLYAFI
jgi:hypothetical protein